MELWDVSELWRLREENAKQKELLADTLLDKEALRDLLGKKWRSQRCASSSSAFYRAGVSSVSSERASRRT